MAIKVYGDKIVFPDGTEQITASDVADTSYTKEEIDAQQEAQDVKIDKNASDLTNVYTKEEVDDSQSEQDTEISKKIDDAPSDNETYARNNSTWVSIGGSSGIPDAPVDGVMYGRKDGDWNPVADAGDVYTKTETNDLLDDKADKSTTYTKSEVDLSQQSQDSLIQANADAIANLPTPVDTYTKAEIDASQNAQDVEIAKKANTDDTYTKTQTDTLLDSKANVGDSYTKAETYTSVEVDTKLFDKADKATTYTKTEVDASQATQDTEIAKKANQATTYTKTEVDASQSAQDTKIDKNKTDISSNTSAIGTLSGRVSANEQDIATLQDGVFFSSSYTADYPDNPNRDPQTGNIYLQNISAFTYSYADANQVFISKTDEQGNVRQFTAVKPDDILVLNQVESPNYGRYKVTSVNDVGDYVNIIMEFQIGEGTLLEGDTIALQAFPASAGGSGGGIPEAPVDGKQYARQDEAWTEVTGGGEVTPSVTYVGSLTEPKILPSTSETDYRVVPFTGDGWVNGKFTADTKGSYALNVGLSWSLINPIADQTFRRCILFVNNVAVSTKSHGVDEMYPHGSKNESNWVIDLEAGDEVEIKALQQNTQGADQNVANNKETYVRIAMLGGGGSGGGDYTPEDLVWEDKSSERELGDSKGDKVYTNNYDTPLLVTITTLTEGQNAYSTFVVDGNNFATLGHGNSEEKTYNTATFTIPAGSTYEVVKGLYGTNQLEYWNEAKMPVAIGTGGGSGGGYTPEKMVWEDKTDEREYNTVYTNPYDTPLYVDFYSKCEDSEYYEIYVDGVWHGTVGNETTGSTTFDKAQLIIPAKATYKIDATNPTGSSKRWFEAKMPLAIGSGGDSIWKDVDGDAVLETKDKKLTIDANVGELGLKSRITTDASILELKAGSGGLPDVTISDTGLTTEADITVNGMTVGASSSLKNTYVGKNALSSVTNGMFVVAVGEDALKNSADGGAYNTAIGYNAGGNLTTGSGNICIGYQAEASSPTVTNEVTIGNDDITKTRLKGAVTNTHSSGAEVKLYDGTVTTTTTRSDLNVNHHVFQDETGQIGAIRSFNGALYFDGLVTTFAQVEGLEAKLSAKDKLIEKLSARLDKLEKKVK